MLEGAFLFLIGVILGPHPLVSLKTACSLSPSSFCQQSPLLLDNSHEHKDIFDLSVFSTHAHTHTRLPTHTGPLIRYPPLAIASFLYSPAEENFWKELSRNTASTFSVHPLFSPLPSGFCHQQSDEITVVLSQMNSICHNHWALFCPHASH